MTELHLILDNYADSAELWTDWHSQVRRAVVPGAVDEPLSEDQCWTLTGWAEVAASQAVRTGNGELLSVALRALAFVEDQKILDRRDLWVVVDLIHRAAQLGGISTVDLPKASSISERYSSRDSAPLDLHDEVGEGASFEFVRRKTGIDVDQLLEKFGEPKPESGV